MKTRLLHIAKSKSTYPPGVLAKWIMIYAPVFVFLAIMGLVSLIGH
jgi:hypothetical protein